MKNILVINGHPDSESFNRALAEAYVKGVETTSAKVTMLHLYELDFDPILKYGYRKRTTLEPDLQKAIDLMKDADHIVWVFPMWWYGMPALLKGFIDRTFLPGITYQPIEGKALPKKLFSGKTARIILTADTPKWYDVLVMKRPAIRQFKKGTLEYCGFSPVKVTYLSPTSKSTSKTRRQWLQKVERIGGKLL